MLTGAPPMLCTQRKTRLNLFLALCPAYLHHLSQPLQGNPGFICLSTSGLRLAQSSQNYTIWIPHLPKTNLIGTWLRTFVINGLPFVSVEHSLSYYVNLCLLSCSPFLLPSILYYSSKLILVYIVNCKIDWRPGTAKIICMFWTSYQ